MHHMQGYLRRLSREMLYPDLKLQYSGEGLEDRPTLAMLVSLFAVSDLIYTQSLLSSYSPSDYRRRFGNRTLTVPASHTGDRSHPCKGTFPAIDQTALRGHNAQRGVSRYPACYHVMLWKCGPLVLVSVAGRPHSRY